jgi:hypothetical protein
MIVVSKRAEKLRGMLLVKWTTTCSGKFEVVYLGGFG